MIKTLRITSIIAAIAATVLLVLPAVYGVRSDPKIEEFLKSPGTIDKFTAAKGQGPAKDESQTSPLVKQAADFGRYLNPPPPPPPKVVPGAAPQGPAVPAPPVVAAKFDLIATSYYASHPEQSFVLIDEPGKGLHWVKQGSAVGHLTIETVKDGAIVVRDGQRTSEMTVKVQEAWRNLLKNPPPSTRPSSSSVEPASPASQAPTARPGPENPVQPSPVTANKTGPPSMQNRRNPRAGTTPPATDRITPAAQPSAPATIQPPPAVEITPPPEEKPVTELSPQEKEIQAKIDKLTAEAGSPGITPDEAGKKIDEMGELLEQLGKIRASQQSAKPQQNSPNQPPAGK